MPTPLLTAELMQEAVDAVAKYGSQTLAAEALGLSRSTLLHRYRRGIIAGLDQAIVHPAPQGHTVKGVSTLYVDGVLRSQWIKTKAGETTLEEALEAIRGAFEDMRPSAPIPAPDVLTDDDHLTLYPLPDLHLGLYAWHGEAGENWDIQIAVERYRDTMHQVAACSPASGTAVVLGGGDYLHANTNDLRTNSGNVLDGDGRTDKVIDEAVKLAVFQVDLALQKHSSVIVRFLKGNHDEYASIAIVYALAAYYRNEPRVFVDKDPQPYWWHRFGRCLFGAAHGDRVKVADMPLIMANRVPRDWGETVHRFLHLFHIHHKTQHVFEHGGVIAESHQSPVAQDAYHFAHGYLSGRSMQSITYHRERGEVARNRVSLA
jgi:hypothetical protein